MRIKLVIISVILSSIFACQNEIVTETLFVTLNPEHTGIDFTNNLEYNEKFNIYTYRNFYNGGGVAIGDVNNDSLPDLYFTANMSENKLYLNQGDFKFKDVTSDAGVGGEKAWSTGVSMVDINFDGWLDIYVCNSGDVEGDNKQNELFVNQKDGTFREEASKYGLADEGYSTHAAFFDYDKDGDLDMYLLNNSYRAISSFNPKINIRDVRDKVGGDKLYKNEGNTFVDVSEAAGIYGSEIGFGLGITVGDINGDHWDDLYISNDFFEKDYIYINNQDGTFSESLEDRMRSISVASMGADMSDLNNDGSPEIFVTEMLPVDERRMKMKITFEDWDKYASNIENGYYHQFTRNMLHLNNGKGEFSEIGRFAGVEASDWSWGALLVDLNNDGLRDIFVANGINKDLTDQDFINFLGSEETLRKMTAGNKVNYKELIDVIPSERIPNLMFVNQGKLVFKDKAKEWGLNQDSHSNGSAYGDLDNDGDLDLIVNNVNMPPFIYKNNANQRRQSEYIQVKLRGNGKNISAIGSKIWVYSNEQIWYDQFMPNRGFQSSMDHRMHFALPENQKVDSIKVLWPNLMKSIVKKPPVNQVVEIAYDRVEKSKELSKQISSEKWLNKVEVAGLDYLAKENKYIDFDKDRLLFHMMSANGPRVEVGDLNNDKKDDIVICGSKGEMARILLQTNQGFVSTNTKLLEQFKSGEDQDVALLDYNEDGKLDIFFSRGGHEFSNESLDIKDVLLINLGKGKFKQSDKSITKSFVHCGATDVSNNNLALAELPRALQFGVPTNAKVFAQGKSTDLPTKGIFSDIKWADLNGDGEEEIISCGKYLPLSIATQGEDESWVDATKEFGLDSTNGWWNTIEFSDLDEDGDLDIIAGNLGLNSRIRASSSEPACLHVNDFDLNGSVEQILCTYREGKSYPLALRHDLIKQLPHLKKRIIKYEDYALKTIDEIFTPQELSNMITHYAYEFETCVFINNNGKFVKSSLPKEVQYSTVNAISVIDVNRDGHLDLVMGGNLYGAKPEIGRYDASQGVVLLGNGSGQFKYVDHATSGFEVSGQVRDITQLSIGGKDHILVSRNNDSPVIFAF